MAWGVRWPGPRGWGSGPGSPTGPSLPSPSSASLLAGQKLPQLGCCTPLPGIRVCTALPAMGPTGSALTSCSLGRLSTAPTVCPQLGQRRDFPSSWSARPPPSRPRITAHSGESGATGSEIVSQGQVAQPPGQNSVYTEGSPTGSAAPSMAGDAAGPRGTRLRDRPGRTSVRSAPQPLSGQGRKGKWAEMGRGSGTSWHRPGLLSASGCGRKGGQPGPGPRGLVRHQPADARTP